jgi:hypothetical protein
MPIVAPLTHRTLLREGCIKFARWRATLFETAYYENTQQKDKLSGANLLDDLTAMILQYVVLKKHEARAVALSACSEPSWNRHRY